MKEIIDFNLLVDTYKITTNIVKTEMGCQKVNLAPGETVSIVLSIKNNYISVEEGLYLYAENPDAIKYSVEIDETIIINEAYMTPFLAGNSEYIKFGKQRIKKSYVKLTFSNLDMYNAIKIWFKVYIDYILRSDYEEIVEPILEEIGRDLIR